MNSNAPKQQQKGTAGAAGPAAKKRGGIRSALGYAFSPGLGNAVQPLKDNFRFFRQTLALLFLGAGLLDRSHPFFRPDVRYTIGDVYRETRARVDWKDQTKLAQNVFFVAVWGLLGLSLLWIATLVLYLVASANPALAADPDPAPAADRPLFGVIPGSEDIATQFIDNLIEGTPITGIGTAGQEGFMPAGPVNGLIQAALRGMLQFYSSAVLAFASFLLLYHVINMVVKAAWSGKALEGAAQLWAPLRLVLAICLLVPLGTGLNAAQLMTLEIAKLGSGLATSAWQVFGAALTNTTNTSQQITANLRGVEEPVKRLMIIYGCMADINLQAGRTIDAVRTSESTADSAVQNDFWAAIGSEFVSWTTAAMDLAREDMIREKVNTSQAENEKLISVGTAWNPNLCGLTVLPVERDANSGSEINRLRGTIQNSISEQSMALRGKVKIAANCMAAFYRVIGNDNNPFYETAFTQLCPQVMPEITIESLNGGTANASAAKDAAREAIANYLATAIKAYYQAIAGVVQSAAQTIQQEYSIGNSSWITAGAYFAKISAIQFAIINAAQSSLKASYGNLMGEISNLPPGLAEGTRAAEAELTGSGQRGGAPKIEDLNTNSQRYFTNYLSLHSRFILEDPAVDQAFATIADPNTPTPEQQAAGAVAPGNILVDGLLGSDNTAIIKVMTGQSALSDPINSLFKVGHLIYSAAVWLLVGGAAGNLLSFVPGVGATVQAISNASVVLSYIMLTVSFPVVFILPLLPLTRFLAGLMSWLIGLFEAIASMPLFALAHLNPGGNTLFEPAQRGYHYLLHIALKPVLLIFGMIGVIIVLPIVLYAHNALYSTVINIMWDDKFVNIIDKIMFFLAYAGTAYGFVNIAFKAIDDLSKNAMSWGNFQAYSFRDDSEQISSNTAAFAQWATSFASQAGGALGGISAGIKKDGQAAKEKKLAAAKEYTEQEAAGMIENRNDGLLGGKRAVLGAAGTGILGTGLAGKSKTKFTEAYRKQLKDNGASNWQIDGMQNKMRRGERLAKPDRTLTGQIRERLNPLADKLNSNEQLDVAKARAGNKAKASKEAQQQLQQQHESTAQGLNDAVEGKTLSPDKQKLVMGALNNSDEAALERLGDRIAKGLGQKDMASALSAGVNDGRLDDLSQQVKDLNDWRARGATGPRPEMSTFGPDIKK